MSFFTDPSIDLSAKLLEVLYIFMGIILLYTSFRSFRDKTNRSEERRVGKECRL